MPTLAKVYVGIDPGQNGGVAWLCGSVVIAYPMPQTERDVYGVFDLVPGTVIERFAVIEKVHSMPKQGVASSFTFGVGYGGLRMALIAREIPFDEVTPQRWQRELGISPRDKTETKTHHKLRLLRKAQQFFPELGLWDEPKSKGRQLAVADALLLAYYCRREHERES